MFALSATSMGSTNTGTFYKDDPGKLFPQRLFFDQVAGEFSLLFLFF
jgi:hypothetical protein